MGLRIFRRFKLFPGLRLNISKRGASITAGVPGAHLTVGRDGATVSAGVPGSGVSWRGRLKR